MPSLELAGTRSTPTDENRDHRWRNARTHTLHDPARWTCAILGEHALDCVNPPFHARSRVALFAEARPPRLSAAP